jgi:hypothetical protein
MYDYKYLLGSAQNIKDGEYTTNEVDFGIATPNLGATGRFGLHGVVTTVLAGATEGVYVWVVHGAATAPTGELVGRYFALATLAAGYHFYIPIPRTVLEFVRAKIEKHTSDVTTGNFTMWLGPDEDGAL